MSQVSNETKVEHASVGLQFDKNRQSVGMLSPLRDKINKQKWRQTYTGGEKGFDMCDNSLSREPGIKSGGKKRKEKGGPHLKELLTAL